MISVRTLIYRLQQLGVGHGGERGSCERAGFDTGSRWLSRSPRESSRDGFGSMRGQAAQ